MTASGWMRDPSASNTAIGIETHYRGDDLDAPGLDLCDESVVVGRPLLAAREVGCDAVRCTGESVLIELAEQRKLGQRGDLVGHRHRQMVQHHAGNVHAHAEEFAGREIRRRTTGQLHARAPPPASQLAISEPVVLGPTTRTSRPRYGSGSVCARVRQVARITVEARPVGHMRLEIVPGGDDDEARFEIIAVGFDEPAVFGGGHLECHGSEPDSDAVVFGVVLEIADPLVSRRELPVTSTTRSISGQCRHPARRVQPQLS